MRSIAIGICLTLAGCVSLVDARTAARIQHFDATDGNMGEYQLVYITKINPELKSQRTALVVLRKSGKHDLAYGYEQGNAQETVGRIDETRVLVAENKENPAVTISIVNVTEAQYTKTKSIITTHTNKTDQTDGPTILFYNCVSEILRTCNMKVPYRSAYRTPDPVQWIGDIPAYSMDLAIK